MRCPRCAEKGLTSDLSRVDTDDGTSLDFCAACGGVWFDKGEVETHLSPRLALSGQTSPTELPCPRCPPPATLDLLKLPVAGAPLLDRCRTCEGVWFDQGEVARLKLLVGGKGTGKLGFSTVQPAGKGGAAPAVIVPVLDVNRRARISWSWVLYGFLVLMALLGAGSVFVNAWIASDAFLETSDPTSPTLLIALCSATAFALGGFLVGWRSQGFTLWEPALVAIPAALCFPLLFGDHFTPGQLAAAMAGGVVITLLGAAFGERFQAS